MHNSDPLCTILRYNYVLLIFYYSQPYYFVKINYLGLVIDRNGFILVIGKLNTFLLIVTILILLRVKRFIEFICSYTCKTRVL